jgi:hypothetical protein
LALVRIALSGVAKLANPRSAPFHGRRADEGWGPPSVILSELGFDRGTLIGALGNYSPDQPRVPAGNPDGRQWTSEHGAGADSNPGEAAARRDRMVSSHRSTRDQADTGRITFADIRSLSPSSISAAELQFVYTNQTCLGTFSKLSVTLALARQP